MTLTEIAVTLERLGCPREKSASMASQLDRRARIKAKLHLRDGNELLREAIRWIEKAAEHPAKLRKTDYRSHLGVIDLSPRHVGRR